MKMGHRAFERRECMMACEKRQCFDDDENEMESRRQFNVQLIAPELTVYQYLCICE